MSDYPTFGVKAKFGNSVPWGAGGAYPRPMTEPRTLGGRLRSLRVGRGLKQAVVADAIGLGRPSLSMIEKDRDQPGRETLLALATYYKVSVDYLLTGETPSSVPEAAQIVDRPDEIALLDFWRGLDGDQRETVLGLLGARLSARRAG